MKQNLIPLLLFLVFIGAGCTEEFDPASQIRSQRFLAIAAEPLQAAPGEDVLFSALVVDKDGAPYEGAIAWTIAGGDVLRSRGEEAGQEMSYLETPGGDPFVWTVPSEDELETQFGPMGKDGLLLTVIAAAFPGGDPDKEPLFAFKSFVVSRQGAVKKFFNPLIDRVEVTAGGEPVEENEEGEYVTDFGKVGIKAVPDSGWQNLTYHWFANDGDFEPDFSGKQSVQTKNRDTTTVYCVLRKEFWFSYDDDTTGRIIGLDWRYVPIRKP